MMDAGHHHDELSLSNVNTTVYLVSSIVLLVIGAVGNILLVTAILAVKQLRTIHNVFIFNLVFVDCVSLLLLEGVNIANLVYEQSPLANDTQLCKVVSFFCLSADIGSVWSAASCALQLYFRICHKAIFKVIYTPQIVTVMIFWLWSLCPMIIIPSMMGWGGHRFDSRLRHCTYDSTVSPSFTYFMLTTGVWVPLAITSYCLIRSVVYLYYQPPEPAAQVNDIHLSLETEAPPSSPNFIAPQEFAGVLTPPAFGFSARENAVVFRPPPPPCITTEDNVNTTRSVMAMSVTMIMAWTTMSIVWIRGAPTSFKDPQYVFAMVLAHSPRCLNSIVYAIVNKDFRKAYWHLVSCQRQKVEESQMVQDNHQALESDFSGIPI